MLNVKKFSLQKFTIKRFVAALAATGLAAFGAAAVTASDAGAAAVTASAAGTASAVTASAAGTPSAVTGTAVTSCTLNAKSILVLSTYPTCTAGDSTIHNPTAITVSAQTGLFQAIEGVPGLAAILAALGDPLKQNVTYTLACQVDGSTSTYHGSFQATTSAATLTQKVNLAAAVGSPAPTQCTIEDLTATSLLQINSVIIAALSAKTFDFGASATAHTVTPGAVYANYPSDGIGAHAVVCADDTDNGYSGSRIQAFQCLSDLADYWIQVSTHQFVHNGACLTDSGGVATLERCVLDPTRGSGQIWLQQHAAGAGTLSNADGAGCLTAPKSGMITFAVLRVAACSGGLGREWTVPAATVG